MARVSCLLFYFVVLKEFDGKTYTLIVEKWRIPNISNIHAAIV